MYNSSSALILISIAFTKPHKYIEHQTLPHAVTHQHNTGKAKFLIT